MTKEINDRLEPCEWMVGCNDVYMDRASIRIQVGKASAVIHVEGSNDPEKIWVQKLAQQIVKDHNQQLETPPSEILGASQEVKEIQKISAHQSYCTDGERISQLEKQVGDLTIERDVAREEYQGKCDHIQSLESENGQLKQALERISKGWTIMENDELSDIAKSALSAIEKEKVL